MGIESLIKVATEGKLLSEHLEMLAYSGNDPEVKKKLKKHILSNLKDISEHLNEAIEYVESKR